MTTTIELPDGVRRIDSICESGPLVCLTKEVDLDDLLIAVAGWERTYGRYDEPTSIPTSGWQDHDVLVGWFRKTPCHCGDDHQWDIEFIGREKPEGKKRYGAFLGVWFA